MQKLPDRISSLSADLVLEAYKQGYFPMAHGKQGPMEFYYYEPRGILPLDERFKIRRSLRQIISKKHYEIRFDTAFEEVIRTCARHDELPDEGIWLSEEMIGIYCELHRRGIAHSVEAWSSSADDAILQGGLYGLTIGSAFCGESMFSKTPFSSQAALVALVEHLRNQGFTLLDSQMESEHLKQFGLYTVSQQEYLEILRGAMRIDCSWNN
ncbi:MAG: leucyl/phenylalanyl-tRNA--protein transferase [Candidatus Kapaibacterium sp.]